MDERLSQAEEREMRREIRRDKVRTQERAEAAALDREMLRVAANRVIFCIIVLVFGISLGTWANIFTKELLRLRKVEAICEAGKHGAKIELRLDGDLLKGVKIVPDSKDE